MLERLAQRSSIICLQEVHGTKEEMNKAFHLWHKDWDWYISAGTKRRTGGCVTFVRKGTFVNDATISPTAHVPGRALELHVVRNMESLAIWNVHNYDIPIDAVTAMVDKILLQKTAAQSQPLERAVFVTGDWNFRCRDDTQQSLIAPSGPRDRCDGSVLPTQARWERALGTLVEYEQPDVTHFWPRSMTCSRIDRTYGSLHGWILRNLDVRSHVVDDPKRLFDTGLSDHAPLVTSLAWRPPAKRREIPISKVVAKSKAFRQYHDELWSQIDLRTLGPAERWETHKTVIRMAGDAARKKLFDDDLDNKEVKALALSSIARAVWQNNVTLAKRLIQQSPLAASHIEVVLRVTGSAEVELRNPLDFQKTVEASQRAILDDRRVREETARGNARTEKTKSKCNGRIRGIVRLAKLWSPFDRRLTLTGIRIKTIKSDAGSLDEAFVIARGDRQVGEALANGWENVFANVRNIDEEAAKRYLDQWSAKYDFSRCKIPTSASYQSFLDRARHSTTGPDGIPYAAWQNTNGQGAITLYQLGEDIACGLQPGLSYNSAVTIFAPKGDDRFDAEEITREAETTRPLSLKNDDNKTIAAVYNSAIAPVISENMVDVQRGFIPGRQSCQNIVDLDSAGRAFGMEGEVSFSNLHGPHLCPLLAFYDFAAAFPSLIQRWMFLVLTAIGMPAGIFNVVEANYFFVDTHTTVGQRIVFLFLVRCGVLQGCPLSGTLFAISVEPFLRHMRYEVQNKGGGIVRACADDVGIAIVSINTLLQAKLVFDFAELFSGLTLKPKKCQLIPVCAVVTPELEVKVKGWLTDLIPDWAAFTIASAGKYLGLWLGTLTSDKQFASASDKWRKRAVAIADTHCSGVVAAHLYASRALPVLGYISQFVVCDEKTARRERYELHHLLHFAQSSMPEVVMHNIWMLNGPKMPAVRVFTLASLARAAHSTLRNWRPNYDWLKGKAEEFVPGKSYVNGCVSPACFDSPAIVDTLRWADGGFVGTLFGLPRNSFVYKLQPLLCEAAREAKLRIVASRLPAQTTFSELIRKRCVDADITPIVGKIISRNFGVEISAETWPRMKALLQGTSVHFATIVLKTWFNSWATTARFHDARCPHCVFGCPDAEDDLKHYVACNRLWSIVRVVFKDSAAGSLEDHLILADATQEKLQRLVVAFHTFHAVRGEHIATVRAVGRTRRLRDAPEAARLFLAEANAIVVRFGF
jgi:hypothetical protein